jgi:hypothetical protein
VGLNQVFQFSRSAEVRAEGESIFNKEELLQVRETGRETGLVSIVNQSPELLPNNLTK